MKQAIDKAGAAVKTDSGRLEGKWLAFAADDLVEELVLPEDGGGTLKRFDREGRLYLSLDLIFDPRSDYFTALPVAGETLELPCERSRDGRLTVHFPAHEKKVFTKSARLISEACMEGDLDRLLLLGRYYFRAGSEECVLLFTEAARRGSTEGKVYLGNYYYYQDKGRAFGYYLEAAEQGHPRAELYVGLYYWSGEGGIGQDREKGFLWLTRAAEHGNEVARAILRERREGTAGEALGSVEAVREYLADAANAEGAVPLRAAIDLGEDWERLLTAIADAGLAVDLDLSGCTVREEVFDPDKRLSTGKDLIVSLTLPASAASVRTGKATARFGPQDLGKADAAFDYFTKLKAVRGAGIRAVGRGAFAMCTALERAEFPKAAAVGSSAFLGCTALKAVEFPAVETVGDMAFAMCTALEQVRLPAAAAIGVSAFIFCDALAEADLPSAEDIGPSACSECGLTVADFPSAVHIGESAFFGCSSLTAVKLPSAVRIGDSAFAECVSLTTVIFPEAVYIGKSAFQDCTSLTTVSLPATCSATTAASSVRSIFRNR